MSNMIVQTFDNEADWLKARLGKITGSRLDDIVVKRGTDNKIGFYELLAERLAKPSEVEETALEHGHRCEPEAISRFEQKTGKTVDRSLVIWSRADNENIAISPDGIVEGTDNTEAIEAKCLSSANHLKAWHKKEIPKDYHYQMLQYFIVNDNLQKLTFAFLDPRLIACDFFTIEVTRSEVLAEIEEITIYQRQKLAEVEALADSILSI